MNKPSARILIPLLALSLAGGLASADGKTDSKMVERGRYLVSIAGCNDCHTARYMERNGAIPEADWLAGSPVGFQGPWGTSYASNLRLYAQSLTEAEWLVSARREMRPPMPWFALREMSDADLKAIYRYLRSRGPKGEPAPAYVPPGEKVATPYFDFVPKNLPQAPPPGEAGPQRQTTPARSSR